MRVNNGPKLFNFETPYSLSHHFKTPPFCRLISIVPVMMCGCVDFHLCMPRCGIVVTTVAFCRWNHDVIRNDVFSMSQEDTVLSEV